MARTRAVPRVFQPPSSSSFPSANITFRKGDVLKQSALERVPHVLLALICSFVSLQTKVLGMLSLSHQCYQSINERCFCGDRYAFRQLPPISLLPRIRNVAALIVDGNSSDITPLFTTCFNDQQTSLRSLVLYRQAGQCITAFQQLASVRWFHLHTLIICDLKPATDFAVLPNFPSLQTFELHDYSPSVTNIDRFLDRHPTITSLTVYPPICAQIWKSTTLLPRLQVLGLGNLRTNEIADNVRMLLSTRVMKSQVVRPICTITSQIHIRTSDTSFIYDLFSSSTLTNINIKCSIADWNKALPEIVSSNTSSLSGSTSQIQSLQLELETAFATASDIETCFQSIASRSTSLRNLALVAMRAPGLQQPTLTPLHSLHQLRILALDGEDNYRSSDMTTQFVCCSDPSHWLHLRSLTLWLTMENTSNRTNVTRFFTLLSPKLTDLIIHSELEPFSAMEILSVIGSVCHNVERLVYRATFLDEPPDCYADGHLLKCASFSAIANTESFRSLVSLIFIDNHWTVDHNGFRSFMAIFRSPLRYLALPSSFSLSPVSVSHLSHYSSLVSIAGVISTAVGDMFGPLFEQSLQRHFDDNFRCYTEPITPTQLPADNDEIMRRTLTDQSLKTWHRQHQWVTDLMQNRKDLTHAVRMFCSNESRRAFFQSLVMP